MPTGPTWEELYESDPEFARRQDRAMDKADEEFAHYLDEHPWKKAAFTIVFVPIMLLLFVTTSLSDLLEKFSHRRRNRKSK